jgi:cystathionine beta-lyase/cystathionine gamma-synthase
MYGGTYNLFNSIFKKFGVIFEPINFSTFEKLDEVLSTKPKWLIFETPCNPTLEVIDIERCTEIAKKYGVMVIVDNTMATPYFQTPLKLGVDLVWHSTSKFLGGHSDIIGGVAMTNSESLKQQIDYNRTAMGLNPSPFDCWLVTRSVKTLAMRMERHQENAFAVANYLSSHPKVSKVFYPGLSTHPSHEIAKKQMRGFGGVLAAEFNLSLDACKQLISSLSLFSLAATIGGIESLVTHPVTMIHGSVPEEERERMGITNGLVRFSVGTESPEDLIDDLKQSLEQV